MNLVAVHTLVAAIVFFIKSPRAFDREVFIVSDDEYPENNFRSVERQLMAGLKIPDYRLKRVGFPPQVLATLLRLTGRTNANPQRRYSCDKLLGLGFRKRTSFGAALAAYARTCAGPEFN
jgi:nucleoside-diphosphate-sugar epimerase